MRELSQPAVLLKWFQNVKTARGTKTKVTGKKTAGTHDQEVRLYRRLSSQ